MNISRVSANHRSQWLSGDKQVIDFKIAQETNMSNDVKNRLTKIWNEYKVSVTNGNFVWRITMKYLKTGEFLKKIKIQRVGFDCVLQRKYYWDYLTYFFLMYFTRESQRFNNAICKKG